MEYLIRRGCVHAEGLSDFVAVFVKSVLRVDLYCDLLTQLFVCFDYVFLGVGFVSILSFVPFVSLCISI